MMVIEVASKSSKKNFTAHEKKRESWRENARKASDRLDDRMKSYERKTSYKLYEKGDKKSAGHMILVGFILLDLIFTNYDIEMEGQHKAQSRAIYSSIVNSNYAQ